jgi:hypothetical protein
MLWITFPTVHVALTLLIIFLVTKRKTSRYAIRPISIPKALYLYTWKTMVLYVWNRGDLSTNQSNYLSNRLNTILDLGKVSPYAKRRDFEAHNLHTQKKTISLFIISLFIHWWCPVGETCLFSCKYKYPTNPVKSRYKLFLLHLLKKNCWKFNKSTIFDQFRSKLLIPTASFFV